MNLALLTIKWSIVLLVFALCNGCSAPQEQEERVEQLRKPEESSNLLNYYTALEDSSCTPENAAINLTSMPSYKQTNTRLDQTNFFLETGTSVPSLGAEVISSTSYGLHRQKKCRLEDGTSLTCDKTTRTIAQAKPVLICNPNKSFARFSPEQIALSTIAGIQEARQAYENTPNRDFSLPKTALTVLPKIEKLIIPINSTDQTLKPASIFDTDNLAYSPNWEGEPTFIIYPKGKRIEERGLWQGVALWESRWVVAHEFGHHVFRYHAEYGLRRGNAHNIHLSPYSSFSNGNQLSSSDLMLINSDLRSRSISVFNEAFADLFAFTVIPATDRPLAELDCFRKSRDVTSSIYENGATKDMNAEVVAIFFGETKQQRTTGMGCTTPRFTDSHSLGAIVAHSIYTHFPAIDSAFRRIELRRALINWAELAQTIVRQDADDLRILFARFLGAFIDAAKYSNVAVDSLCDDFSTRFSGIGQALQYRLSQSCR